MGIDFKLKMKFLFMVLFSLHVRAYIYILFILEIQSIAIIMLILLNTHEVHLSSCNNEIFKCSQGPCFNVTSHEGKNILINY